MGNDEAVLDQIKAADGALHWKDFERLMKRKGAKVEERKGSRVAIKYRDVVLHAHRPHPRKECGKGLAKRVRQFCKDTQVI